MRRSKWLPTLCAAAVLGAAALTSPAVGANSQQEKMTACNADATAKGLNGNDRKAYMKICLSAKSGTGAKQLTPQQAKMKGCNAEADTKSLKGDERKTFMSGCLKATATP
jgi:hypothetical protein